MTHYKWLINELCRLASDVLSKSTLHNVKRKIVIKTEINSMKTLSKTILTVLATGLLSCALFCPQAQAALMTGAITFAGTVSLDTSSAGTATMVTAWHGLATGGLPAVQSHDGSFNGFVTNGDGVTFHSPWSFNSGPLTNFWSVDGFTFNLTISSITTQGGGAVTVDGTGTITGNMFDPTPGSWHFTTQDPAAASQFSFSAATGTVPDGGSAVALLGIALAGIEGARRVLRARKA
jgi:VPDSG-CTERM motif